MIKFNLVKTSQTGDLPADLSKISDYLLTFVGDVAVKKKSSDEILITYSNTPLTAVLKIEASKLVLTCEKNDSLTVNLIKNVTGNLDYRIFNVHTGSYLLADANILDLTTAEIKPDIAKVFRQYNLTPLFQYHDSLVFFAKDKGGKIYLVNRHLLEFLRDHPQKRLHKADFSVIVAPDISHFVALFDRGLISLSFFKGRQKIVNLSGLDIDHLPEKMTVEQITFRLDDQNQTFTQESSQSLVVSKGKSLVKAITAKNYLALKVPQDVSYHQEGQNLVPHLRISVFLDR